VEHMKHVLDTRGHLVICMAEGAGQVGRRRGGSQLCPAGGGKLMAMPVCVQLPTNVSVLNNGTGHLSSSAAHEDCGRLCAAGALPSMLHQAGGGRLLLPRPLLPLPALPLLPLPACRCMCTPHPPSQRIPSLNCHVLCMRCSSLPAHGRTHMRAGAHLPGDRCGRLDEI
jgi:hypothetical protein